MICTVYFHLHAKRRFSRSFEMRHAAYALGLALLLLSVGLLVTKRAPSSSESHRAAVNGLIVMGAKSASGH